MRASPRRGGVSANIGLAAAALTTLFIIYRVAQGGAALPTPLDFSNHSAAAITVGNLQVGEQSVLPAPRALAARNSQGAVAPPLSAQSQLGPGRPARIQASLLTPAALAASCELPPRPHGACRIDASFHGGAELHCVYLCPTSAAPASDAPNEQK